jgi:intracellular multiplication protein IcmT
MAWRDTMRPCRFLMFPAWAAAPLLIFFLHWRWWTLIAAIASAILFWVLERFGLSVPAAMRFARSWVAGPYRPAVPFWKRRWRTSHGHRC